MQGEILVIPTPASMEMLKKSAQILAKYMAKSGITVNEQISLCPDRKRLQHAISKALDRSDLVFTLGGMGRDSGFLAKQVVSEGLGLPLENSREALIAIREFSTRIGIASSADDVTLSSLPTGSRPLIPAHGVIPGCVISSPSQHIVMLPENQEELVPMYTRQVMPILAKAGLSAESSHEMRTYGASEEQVRHLIIDLMGTRNPIVTTRTEGDEVVVKVVATASNSTDATNLSGPILRSIANRLGDYAYGLDVPNLETSLMQKMARKNLTIATAESGTSGKLLGTISKIDPNKSILIGGVIADSIDRKISELGLIKKQLRKKGEVSEYTAVTMANAIRETSDSDIGVSVTASFAELAKGEDYVAYIAVCDKKYVYIKKILVEQGTGNHNILIKEAVSRAINMTRLFVDYSPEPYTGSVPLSKALSGKISVTDKDAYEDFANEAEESPEFYYDEVDEKPKKKSKPRKKGKIRKFILTLAILLFVGGGGYLGLYTVQSFMARNLRDNLTAVYDTTGFNGLKSLNSDTVAFVSLDGTTMRYPIVQYKDNQYYLRRDFNEKSNNHGVPFMDAACDPRKPSDNMIVYGHNMRDGQIFGELLNYKDLEYYKEHSIINFDTIKKKGEYKVFAIFITSADPNHFEGGKVFEYHKFIDSNSDDEFNAFINQIRMRSLLNIPVDVEPGDEIITLSTCDYDFSDSRFVVMARRVRSGESLDVDFSKAEYNPTPLYPDVWYSIYGGIRPDVNNSDYTSAEKTEQSSVSSTISVIEQEPPESTEESKPSESETSSKDDTAKKAEEDKLKAEQEAAKKAEEEKLKAEKEAAKKAEEDKKKAEEAAAAKAEEDKKKAEKEAADKALAEKKKAEDEVVALVDVAAKAATDAASYQMSTLNSSNKAEADTNAESAKASAVKAEEAATKAKSLAKIADSDTAKMAAEKISDYAIEARQSANTAVENAKSKAVAEQQAATPLSADPNDSNISNITTHTGSLSVKSSVNFDPNDDLDIVSRIVQQEVGPSFHPEAIKAQALATYSYIANSNARGITPTMYMSGTVSDKVKNAVSEVMGQAIYYNGKVAYTTYHAVNAGVTTSSASVWGGHYPYLISVDSSVDLTVKSHKVTNSMSAEEVSKRISQKLGIEPSGDPSTWFEVLSYEDGVYNGKMSVCGYTKSNKTGSVLTGRLIRETVLNLRSSAFEVEYDASTDTFYFTTYGFGHCVGMSQMGAEAYAKQGWTYIQILEHYFPGTNVA